MLPTFTVCLGKELELSHQPFDDVAVSVSDSLQQPLARAALVAVVVEPPDIPCRPIPYHQPVPRKPTGASVSFSAKYANKQTQKEILVRVVYSAGAPGIMRVALAMAQAE